VKDSFPLCGLAIINPEYMYLIFILSKVKSLSNDPFLLYQRELSMSVLTLVSKSAYVMVLISSSPIKELIGPK
jgi:hypothetical protein